MLHFVYIATGSFAISESIHILSPWRSLLRDLQKGRQVDLIIHGFSCSFWTSLTRKNPSRVLYHTSEINCWHPVNCMNSIYYDLELMWSSHHNPKSLWVYLTISANHRYLPCSSSLCKLWLYSTHSPFLIQSFLHIDLLQLPSNARPKSGMLQSAVWAASQMRLGRERKREMERKR